MKRIIGSLCSFTDVGRNFSTSFPSLSSNENTHDVFKYDACGCDICEEVDNLVGSGIYFSQGMRRKDLEITKDEEIEKIVLANKLLRLGLFDEKLKVPYIVPMLYAYNPEEFSFYLHCYHHGAKTDIMEKNPFVCFEIDEIGDMVIKGPDEICNSTIKYRSVMGHGVVKFIEDEDRKKFMMDYTMRNIIQALKLGHTSMDEVVYDPKKYSDTLLIQLKITSWVGKQIK